MDKLNEIHGTWFDKKNPVIFMDGELRKDLLDRMYEWKDKTDLVLAMGTSLCGMHADCVSESCAERYIKSKGKVGQGLVIVNLQQTPLDDKCSLRIFAKIDDVMKLLANELNVKVSTKDVFSAYPPAFKSLHTKR